MASSSSLDPQFGNTFSVEPASKHTATVIMLHGLGDTGQGWVMAFEPDICREPHIKHLFPTAPTRPVTINSGMEMPAWFDVHSLGIEDGVVEVG